MMQNWKSVLTEDRNSFAMSICLSKCSLILRVVQISVHGSKIESMLERWICWIEE